MAIDTENKRRSAIGILPVPDGTIEGLDRQQAIGIYRILIAPVVIASIVLHLPERQFVLTLPEQSFTLTLPERVFILSLKEILS